MRPSSGRSGFSFVEVLVSCALLGIGLLGLVDLHMSSLRGLGRGRFATGAKEVATQRGEHLATQAADLATMPSCPAGGGPVGCFQDRNNLAPAKTCTQWLGDPDVPTPSGASIAGAGPRQFRMDTVIGPHPDATNHAAALLVTVSVCWTDESGIVEQVQARRMIVPGA